MGLPEPPHDSSHTHRTQPRVTADELARDVCGVWTEAFAFDRFLYGNLSRKSFKKPYKVSQVEPDKVRFS